jgi:hypothetical protein
VIYLPPGVEHIISNSGLTDLVFIAATPPLTTTRSNDVALHVTRGLDRGLTRGSIFFAKRWIAGSSRSSPVMTRVI